MIYCLLTLWSDFYKWVVKFINCYTPEVSPRPCLNASLYFLTCERKDSFCLTSLIVLKHPKIPKAFPTATPRQRDPQQREWWYEWRTWRCYPFESGDQADHHSMPRRTWIPADVPKKNGLLQLRWRADHSSWPSGWLEVSILSFPPDTICSHVIRMYCICTTRVNYLAWLCECVDTNWGGMCLACWYVG